MDHYNSLEERLSLVEERNKRVENDKAWETSSLRRALIFAFTYSIAALWLVSIEDSNPLLKALVPAFGWYLSTLSLPFVKKRWTEKHRQKDL